MRWKQAKPPLHSASILVIPRQDLGVEISRLVRRVKTGRFHLFTTSPEAPGWLSPDSIEGNLGKESLKTFFRKMFLAFAPRAFQLYHLILSVVNVM
jgi:hypothetical protein